MTAVRCPFAHVEGAPTAGCCATDTADLTMLAMAYVPIRAMSPSAKVLRQLM